MSQAEWYLPCIYGGLCHPTLEVLLICLDGLDAKVYGLHLYGCMVGFLDILPDVRLDKRDHGYLP